jgi:hypothetical protein
MKRALRRHHRKRIIAKFRRIINHWWMDRIDKDEWALMTASRGSIGCGCDCCGNPRRKGKGYGESTLTIQERKEEENAKDQLNKEYEYINGCVVDTAYYNVGCECESCISV